MTKSSNILSKLDSFLVSDFKNVKKSLDEPQENMSLSIVGNGVSFLSYSYDKEVSGQKKVNLLPFLEKKKSVHSMCDYILFCQNHEKLFVLLIELKKGKQEVMTQLNAGKCFVEYVIATLNRVEGSTIKPEIRKIAIRNNNIVKKGASRQREVVYNDEYFYTFQGKNFLLRKFLH